MGRGKEKRRRLELVFDDKKRTYVFHFSKLKLNQKLIYNLIFAENI